MIDNFMYMVPVRVVFGKGRLEEVGRYASQYGGKALIVTTGPFFKNSGLVGRIQKILEGSGVSSELFDEVNPNPLCTQIDKGAEFANAKGCDVIIGLGGGSAIDAAKGIAVAAGHHEPVWNYCPVGGQFKNPTEKTLPIIAITTTSGTGSHISPYAVITNPDTRQKPGMGSDYIYAKVAIVDPELMLSMPARMTASTGFDVLAHAIEAYTSRQATPLTDLFCEESIRLVGRYLRRAVKNGNDIEARTAMALADTYSGFSIAVAVITLCHSISHAVGGVCETVHGETLAAMTPHTMRFSMNSSPEKYRNIGKFLRDECCCEEGESSCESTVAEVEKIIKDIGMDIPLGIQGVKETDFDAIADDTLSYMAGGVNLDPRKATKADILDILRKSL